MISVVWFKRDLRVADHWPLSEAAKRGPLVALYISEPKWIESPEIDGSHLAFINDSLLELDQSLRQRGGYLVRKEGDPVRVLQMLHRQCGFTHLWSHQETGQKLTQERDRNVAAWCRTHNITWHEIAQSGVIRQLKSRDGWARRWEERMRAPIASDPVSINPVDVVLPDPTPGVQFISTPKPYQQRGGEILATNTLTAFLAARGVRYQKEMSSPLTAWNACSRLSPHLAWGTISMRTVYQRCLARENELREYAQSGASIDRRWFAALRAFKGRLHWHCHFMQKLEDEPRIEYENFSSAYDGLRPDKGDPAFSEEWYHAWCRGQTGYPLVDACMRALHATGWINFRMRAMLVSFASYHLWLHWRPTAVFLARHFLDFEPGIHFSQFQMQSGTTGINTLRIYSPTKQALDHDPRGDFVRAWVPELEQVPAAYIITPHKMPASVQSQVGCLINRHYPAPIVDHAYAYQRARKLIGEIRRQTNAREEAERIQSKHGSRRSGVLGNLPRSKRSKTSKQASLFDDSP